MAAVMSAAMAQLYARLCVNGLRTYALLDESAKPAVAAALLALGREDLVVE